MISPTSFLVNAFDEKPALHIAGKIVLIDTKEKTSTGRYAGGSNDNVPESSYLTEEKWNELEKTSEVFELSTRPELLGLYNEVSNALEDEFESTEDFVESHGYFPLN